jgi:hypothetical protein
MNNNNSNDNPYYFTFIILILFELKRNGKKGERWGEGG